MNHWPSANDSLMNYSIIYYRHYVFPKCKLSFETHKLQTFKIPTSIFQCFTTITIRNPKYPKGRCTHLPKCSRFEIIRFTKIICLENRLEFLFYWRSSSALNEGSEILNLIGISKFTEGLKWYLKPFPSPHEQNKTNNKQKKTLELKPGSFPTPWKMGASSDAPLELWVKQ